MVTSPEARPGVVVCVPTYNEAENVSAICEAVTDHGYRALIIDDGSPDGTGAIADQIASRNSLVAVVHRIEKAGLGPAYAAGFRHAVDRLDAHIVCEMDCDFSHDPNDLPRLVAAIDDGADVAIGSRYVPGGSTPGWSLHRQLLSRGGNGYARLMLGIPIRDATSGFRAFRSGSLCALDAESCGASGYGFQVEMAYRAVRSGMIVTEVPIAFRDRLVGDSKMDRTIVLEAMRLVTRWGLDRMRGRGYVPPVPESAELPGS